MFSFRHDRIFSLFFALNNILIFNISISIFASADQNSDPTCSGEKSCEADPLDESLIQKRRQLGAKIQSNQNPKDYLDSLFTRFGKQSDETFTVAIGNGDGVFYTFRYGDDNDPRYYFCYPYIQYSTSKIITTSAIAHFIEVSNNKLNWDTKAAEMIDWWTFNPEDPRSKMVLSDFLQQIGGYDMRRHIGDPGECGSSVPSMNGCVKYAYDYLWCNSTEIADYNALNFITAQLIALNAAGLDDWDDFLEKYWGKSLGLQRAEVSEQSAVFSYEYGEENYETLEPLFSLDIPKDTKQLCNWYGARENKNGLNPGGSSMIMSTTAYSIFMQKYLNGEYKVNRSFIENQPKRKGGQHPIRGAGDGVVQGVYATGCWVDQKAQGFKWSLSSEGALGAMPIWGQMDDGEEIFVFVNIYSYQSVFNWNQILTAAGNFMSNLNDEEKKKPIDLCKLCDREKWSKFNREENDLAAPIEIFGDYGDTESFEDYGGEDRNTIQKDGLGVRRTIDGQEFRLRGIRKCWFDTHTVPKFEPWEEDGK